MLRVVSSGKMGTPRGAIDGQIASISHGFGFSLTRFTGIIETLLVASVAPIDAEDVDVRFSFTVKKMGNDSVTQRVGGALIADIEKQMGEDKPIWENKVFIPRPLLCDGDGPISLFRRWCQQFYSPAPDLSAAVAG